MAHDSFYIKASFLLAAALVLFILPGEAGADGLSERRARVGLDLFPTFLAADDDIVEKKGEDGRLHLLMVHRGSRDLAEEMAEPEAAPSEGEEFSKLKRRKRLPLQRNQSRKQTSRLQRSPSLQRRS